MAHFYPSGTGEENPEQDDVAVRRYPRGYFVAHPLIARTDQGRVVVGIGEGGLLGERSPDRPALVDP
jgi:hypothetical protein